MDIMFLYTLLIFSLVLGIFLLYKVEGKIHLNQINIFNWTYFVEFILMGAVSPFLIMPYRSYNWAMKTIPENEFPLKEVILSLCWIAIAIPLGMKLGYIVAKKYKWNNNYSLYLKEKVNIVTGNRFLLLWLAVFVSYAIYIINQIVRLFCGSDNLKS